MYRAIFVTLFIFISFSINPYVSAQVNNLSKELLKKEIDNYGEKLTNKIPSSYSKEDARKNGDVIFFKHKSTFENKKIKQFIYNVKNNKPDFIRFVEFTSKGDPVITEYQFNGKLIYYRYDSSRDRSDQYRKGTFAMGKFIKAPQVLEDYCKKLVYNSKMSYLTNCYHFDKVEF